MCKIVFVYEKYKPKNISNYPLINCNSCNDDIINANDIIIFYNCHHNINIDRYYDKIFCLITDDIKPEPAGFHILYDFNTSLDIIIYSLKIQYPYLKKSINLNPLTYLPGNIIIEDEITEKIINRSDYGIIYYDINNFKAYNDYYGFGLGDKILKFTSNTLKSVSFRYNDIFNGHIGGDDFVSICPVNDIKNFCGEIAANFDNSITNFYNKTDLKRKGIYSYNRNGHKQFFPIMTIGMACFINKSLKCKSLLFLNEIISGLKKNVKIKCLEENASSFIIQDKIKYLNQKNILNTFLEKKNIDIKILKTFIEILGYEKNNEIRKYLENILQISNDFQIKKSAAFALGQLQYKESIPVLVKMLNYNNPHIKSRTIEALTNINDNSVLPKILPFINDKNKYVRIETIKSVLRLGTVKNIIDILGLLNDKDKDVILTLIKEVRIVRYKIITEKLTEKLDVFTGKLMNELIITLGIIGDKSVIDKILHIFLNNKNLYKKYNVLRAINNIAERDHITIDKNNKQLYDIFISNYSTMSDFLLYEWIRSIPFWIKNVDNKMKIINIMLDLLNHNKTNIILITINSFKYIDGNYELPKIRKMLFHRKSAVKQKAIELINIKGEMQDLKPLRLLLKDPDIAICEQAQKTILGSVVKIKDL